MHPIDHAASEFNLYIDVQLARRLHRRAGYLITTRPGLQPARGAALAARALTLIGQEQMHLGNHASSCAPPMPKQYPKLDALAVLTERDKEAYEALASTANGRPRWCGSRTRCARWAARRPISTRGRSWPRGG